MLTMTTTSSTLITPEVRDAIAVACESIDAAVDVLIAHGAIGLASEIGDARDLLVLLAEDRAAKNLAG